MTWRPRRFGWLVAGWRGFAGLWSWPLLGSTWPRLRWRARRAGRQKFWICSFFAPSCCVQGCPPVGACVCAGLSVLSEGGH